MRWGEHRVLLRPMRTSYLLVGCVELCKAKIDIVNCTAVGLLHKLAYDEK